MVKNLTFNKRQTMSKAAIKQALNEHLLQEEADKAEYNNYIDYVTSNRSVIIFNNNRIGDVKTNEEDYDGFAEGQ